MSVVVANVWTGTVTTDLAVCEDFAQTTAPGSAVAYASAASGTFGVTYAGGAPTVTADVVLQFPGTAGLPTRAHVQAANCRGNCKKSECRQ
jgi:hypothetical protein